MRDKFVVAAIATIAAMAPQVARAATIGPDSFGYTAHDTNIAFVDISSSGTPILGNDDDSAASAAIGFSFNFYGTAYTTAFISTNGLISFGGPNTSFTNQDLTASTTSGDQPTIAAMWDDWVTQGTADQIYYQTTGAPGNQQFIVQWNALNPFGDTNATDHVTFEAILSQATGNILLNFLDTTTSGDHSSGGSATVGIRNTGAPGNGQVLQWSFNTESASLRSGQAIEFTAAPVPEPASLFLLGTGVTLVARRLRRRA